MGSLAAAQHPAAPYLSVIIPLGPSEQGLGRLAADLQLLPHNTEILLVSCPQNTPFPGAERIEHRLHRYPLRWIEAPEGRARQLNAGARAARGEFLWFLHADSGFGPELPAALLLNLRAQPRALHYCRLAFMSDGPSTMGLNQIGANLRSSWLGVPFGDQGFCIAASLFDTLGGYPEGVPYGEDHLFVWYARQAGYPLFGTVQPLYTSARKYRSHGWSRLTLRYQYLWLKQALPEWWKLHIHR